MKHSSADPGRKQPLPWFAFNIADVMTTPGVALIFSDDKALAAMMRFAIRSWQVGRLTGDQARQACGDGWAALVEAGVLTIVDGLYALPWLERTRSELDSMRALQAAKANARWSSAHAAGMPRHSRGNAAGMLGQDSTEERDREAKAEEETRHTEESLTSTPPSAGNTSRAKTQSARKEPTGDHAEVIRHFKEVYEKCYGQPYAFQGGKDGRHVKTMLGYAKGDLCAVKNKIDLAFKDDYKRDKLHIDLGTIVQFWNKITGPSQSLGSVGASPRDLWMAAQLEQQKKALGL